MREDDPNDAVVLHNLGVAFTEEGMLTMAA